MSFRMRPILLGFLLSALFLSSSVLVLANDLSGHDGRDLSKRNSIGKRKLSDAEYKKLTIIHASVGSAATMVVFPIGILGARGLRVLMHRWWIIHAILQGVFGWGLIIAAFTLGVIMVGQGKDFTAGHRRTGLVLFVLVSAQCIIGLAIRGLSPTKVQHPSKVPSLLRHPLQNWFHVLMGLAIVGLGYWQTYSGFALYNKEVGGNDGSMVPLWTYIVWAVLLATGVLLYLVGLSFLPAQFRKERDYWEGTETSQYGTSKNLGNGNGYSTGGATGNNGFGGGQGLTVPNGTQVDDSAVDTRRSSVAPLIERNPNQGLERPLVDGYGTNQPAGR